MENRSVSEVIRALVARSGLSMGEVSRRSGVNLSTLKSLCGRNCDRVSISVLKALADFFDEDLEVFYGSPDYVRRPRLTDDEEKLLATYRGLDQSGKAAMYSSSSLSVAQKRLLAGAGQLNSQGQAKLLDSCEDLIASGRYKK